MKRYSALLLLLMAVISSGCSPDYKNPYEYSVDKWVKTPTNMILFERVNKGAVNLAVKGPPLVLNAVAVGPSNTLYVADEGGKIFCLDKEGRIDGFFATSNAVKCLAVGADGVIYAGMKDHVEVLSRRGERMAEWTGLGENSLVTSIALGSNDVFVADFGNRTVWRYSKTGVLLGNIGKSGKPDGSPAFILPSPYFDVAVAPDGELWIANPGTQSIGNYSYDGVLKKSWGRAAMEPDGFSGCCNPSHFAIGPDGSFFTSEKGIPRVKVHRPDGSFEGFVAGAETFDLSTVGLDLAVGSDGRVFVLYPRHHVVRIYERIRK